MQTLFVIFHAHIHKHNRGMFSKIYISVN